MTDEDHCEDDMELLDWHVAKLMEHFETCQIFCTRHTPRQTVSANTGAGNWYAREGQISEWTRINDERVREHVRNNG